MEADRPRPGFDVELTSFLAYNLLLVPVAVGGFHLARLWSEKVRAGAEGRSGWRQRVRELAPRLRGCVWVHASSAGEYEQARPILRALRAAYGDALPLLSTAFSPSGHAHATAQREADAVEFLPLDTPGAARFLMRTLEPRAVVFVKFDCWPNVVWSARRARVPLFLLDATYPATSRRGAPLVRGFFARLFDCFDQIGAIAREDRDRLLALGVRAPISVTGDTKAEQVLHRFEASEAGALHRELDRSGFRYVTLGSVWPAGQAVVMPPLLDRLEADPALGLIAVPHEPSPAHLESIERELEARGLASARLSELVEPRTHRRRATAAAKDPARWRCIVVDTVGALAEIYRASILSYVGGAFGAGVHNVLEPAVTSQPVLFGPRHRNALEAGRLVERGAARVVRDSDDVRAALELWLDDEAARRGAGDAARAYVEEQRGATDASVSLLRPYLA